VKLTPPTRGLAAAFLCTALTGLAPFALTGWGAQQALAQAALQNVSLSNISVKLADGADVTVPKIDVTGTNLTQAELQKIFTNGPAAEVAALNARMKAQKIDIPTVTIAGGKDKQTMEMKGFVIEGVDQGKAQKVTLTSANMKREDGTTLNLKPTRIEGLDLTGNVATLLAGKAGGSNAVKLDKAMMEGGDISFVDKAVKADAPGGNIVRMALGPVTINNTYAGNVITRGAIDIKSLTIVGPPTAQFTTQLKELGYDKLELSIASAGSYDPAKKTLGIENLQMSGPAMGSFGLKGTMTDVGEGITSGDQAQTMVAMLGAGIERLELNISNQGLFQKAFAFAAKQQGKTAEALIGESKMMATAMLPMMLGGDPGVMKLASALGQFMDSPGALNVVLTGKSGPVKIMQLAGVKNPQDALKFINIDASSTK
jgi:uncharacterized protein YjbI with pentapeptide repeats